MALPRSIPFLLGGYEFSGGDTVDATDALAIGFGRTNTDTVGITDAITASFSAKITKTDSASIIDDITVNKTSSPASPQRLPYSLPFLLGANVSTFSNTDIV